MSTNRCGCIASRIRCTQGSPSPLTFPGLVTIPIGFFGCWLGTMLGRADSAEERSYDELLVRSETGIGSEGGPAPATPTGRFKRTEEPAPVR